MKEDLIKYHSESKKQRDAKFAEIIKKLPKRKLYCDAYITNASGIHKKWVGRIEALDEKRMKHQQRLYRDKYGIDTLFTNVKSL